MSRNNNYPQANQPGTMPGMFMGGGDASGFTYVGAESLKEKDAPTEAMLGTVNGAIGGALASLAVSAAFTAGREGTAIDGLGSRIAHNATGKHLLPILAGTTALGAIGGLVQFSRARKHNEWSEKHYHFLMAQQAAARDSSYANQLENEAQNNTPASKGPAR